MMNTPRTDAAMQNAGSMSAAGRALLETSRQLERELTAEQEKVKQLTEALKAIAFQPMSNDWARELAAAFLEKTK